MSVSYTEKHTLSYAKTNQGKVQKLSHTFYQYFTLGALGTISVSLWNKMWCSVLISSICEFSSSFEMGMQTYHLQLPKLIIT